MYFFFLFKSWHIFCFLFNSFLKKEENMNSIIKKNKKEGLLCKEEERKLIIQAQQGDESAKSKLIIKNYRFVLKISHQYKNRYLELEDIINEGIIGMMNAIEKFDTDKEIRFVSYAIFWIKQSIIKAIAEKMRAFKVPLNVNNHLFHISKLKESKRDNSELIENLSSELQMDKKKISRLLSVNKKPISINAIIPNSKNQQQLADKLLDEKSSSIEKKVMDHNLREKIEIIVKKTLNPIEKVIINARYGLENGRCMTLAEVGREIQYTKERVRQLETIALKKLYKNFPESEYQSLLDCA